MDRNTTATAIGQYRASESGLAGAGTVRQMPTLTELGELADKQRAQFWELVGAVDRLADRLDGPSNAPRGLNSEATDSKAPDSLCDVLHAAVAGFDEPAYRIKAALQRIERRLG